ncbi:MAG: GntR family transcriptional regulator [Peptococcaceae bacterium BICA1-7]|nr:MAG: GntR family transcriptional regulator [Peptococcaceae bacterium BICA1-7]HBV99522.1 GntR family transcriptional regulator [Desulfotomaculum sp.]
MDSQSSGAMARYVTIAIDIASRIVRGEYREGQKVFGRSTLAGKYNVSPETIRRALTLLQDTGIVDVSPGVGVVVRSKRAAETFLAQSGQRQILRDLQERLHTLLRQRDNLNQEIEKLTNDLLDYTFKMAGRLQKIEEIKVNRFSPLVGRSLVEAEFRGKTGATVLAIYRNGEEIVSPRADTIIEVDDVLIMVSQPEMKEELHRMVDPD